MRNRGSHLSPLRLRPLHPHYEFQEGNFAISILKTLGAPFALNFASLGGKISSWRLLYERIPNPASGGYRAFERRGDGSTNVFGIVIIGVGLSSLVGVLTIDAGELVEEVRRSHSSLTSFFFWRFWLRPISIEGFALELIHKQNKTIAKLGVIHIVL